MSATSAGEAASDSADREGPHATPANTFQDALGSGDEGSAADYSKCADFLNVEPPEGERRGYAFRGTGPFLPDRAYYYPFRLEADGRVVPNPHGVDGVRHTTRNEGATTVHVFDYPVPSMEDIRWDHGLPLVDAIGGIASKPDRIRKALVTVTQGPETMEVVEDLNLGPEERNAVQMLPYYEELQDFVPVGTRTVFDIGSGECVPRERTEILAHRNEPDRLTETLTF